jgi:hypothetical protein
MDQLDVVLTGKFTRFLMMRAESFVVLQRKPAEDYDISFLITNEHTDMMWKHKVVDFLIQFMEDVDAQVCARKCRCVDCKSFLRLEWVGVSCPPCCSRWAQSRTWANRAGLFFGAHDGSRSDRPLNVMSSFVSVGEPVQDLHQRPGPRGGWRVPHGVRSGARLRSCC